MAFSRLLKLNVRVGKTSLASSQDVYSGAITFIYDTDYETGTYWNGDPWVLRPIGGSVTITSMTPNGEGDGVVAASIGADRVRNGAMLNWNTGSEAAGGSNGLFFGTSEQAFDSHQPSVSYPKYVDSRQVDPALTGASLVVSAEGTVLKAKSQDDGSIPAGSGARGNVLTDMGLLTIVDRAPPSNAFRPGAHAIKKASRWTATDVDYSLVPSGLNAPASAPSYGIVLDWVGRHHLMGSLNYNSNRVHMPKNHMANYGAKNARNISSAILLAMTDTVTAEQRKALIKSVVQIGIDVYDRYNEGGRWHVNGGLYRGYKFPLVVAATLLDDVGMKVIAGINPNTALNIWDAFGDDRSIWHLTSADTDRALDGEHEQYNASDEGDPEWGEQHTYQNNRDDRRENASYRAANTNYGIVGAALACQMIAGARDVWNWQAHFDYADRVMERDFYASAETLRWGGTNYIKQFSSSYAPQSFFVDMWTAHRSQYGGALWGR